MFGSFTLEVLEKAMDINWFRQQLIANNIANVDTPNYKRQDVDFQKSLEKALAGLDTGGPGEAGDTQPDLLDEGAQPVIIESDNTSGAVNGNNVDLENELSQQAMNLLQYNALARLESDQLGMLKTAITEGKG
jgi:flagellar basal-body rod protein FlgB